MKVGGNMVEAINVQNALRDVNEAFESLERRKNRRLALRQLDY